MDIGLKVQIFNYRMRERRREMGLTQAQLGELAGVGITVVQTAAPLTRPRVVGKASLREFFDRLQRVAEYLGLDFDELFPVEYLEACIEGSLLEGSTFYFRREVSIDELKGVSDSALLTDGGIEEIEDDTGISEVMMEAIECIESEKLREVIRLRFGFGCEPMTLKEVGEKMGYTPERVRQMEAKALRDLRHPRVSRKLRELL